MKEVEIEVSVQYTCCLTAFIPDDAVNSLEHMEEKYPFGYNPILCDEQCSTGLDWINGHINEDTACVYEYEVHVFDKKDC